MRGDYGYQVYADGLAEYQISTSVSKTNSWITDTKLIQPQIHRFILTSVTFSCLLADVRFALYLDKTEMMQLITEI